MKAKKILSMTLVFVLAMTLLCIPTAAAGDDALSFADAAATELAVTVDGKALKVTMYEDVYVKNPTTVAMIPGPGVDQMISVYVPENATASSPILFYTNNGGWIMDAYVMRNQIEDGAAYVSDSDADLLGAALKRGFVVVSCGCRSRGDHPNDAGEYVSHSPATMTDTKAAIRYLRYNQAALPAGDCGQIVITGTSGGGALSTIIAASGNSPDYFESLYEIGAAGVEKSGDAYVSTLGDDVYATVAYCPINDLRESDAAYEWTYQSARQRLVDAGLPAVNQESGQSFQDPFTDDYTPEWMLAASKALAAQYGEYVDALGLKMEDGKALSAANLDEATRALLNRELAEAAGETGVEQMKRQLAGESELTAVYNSASADWAEFLSYDASGTPYIADQAALENFFYFVARNQTLKVACAFSNKGLSETGLASVSGYNEDSLFGSRAYPYSAYEFYAWDNDAVAGNGCGRDDTGLTWDEYMATPEGEALARQLEMASPIPYLTAANGDSAPYWYVRHGMRDRDTAFSLQTVLYYALYNDASIENLDFEFAWLQGHAGNYDVQEAFAWLDSVLPAPQTEEPAAEAPVAEAPAAEAPVAEAPAAEPAPAQKSGAAIWIVLVVAAAAVVCVVLYRKKNKTTT